MESLLRDAQVAARLALQLVVTVVQFHHPRTHRLEQAVVERLQAPGAARARPEWRQVIAAWDVFSRELGRYMHEGQDLGSYTRKSSTPSRRAARVAFDLVKGEGAHHGIRA